MQKTDYKFWIIILLAGVFLGLHFYSGKSGLDEASILQFPDYDTEMKSAEDTPVSSLRDFNDAIVNIAKKANPTVVTVFTSQTVSVVQRNPFHQFFGGPEGYEREFQREGLGSGVIASKDGYIITNNHVIQNADSISVRFINDEVKQAKVIGADPLTDIAVLKVDAENLPAVEFGNSDSLDVGESVLAIGSPLSANLDHTVTMGIVSATGRSNLNVIGQQGDRPGIENFIQTDAAINPGNSGGALINIDGKLVGINSAIASRSGGFQGIGLAIPINMAKNVMESLIEYGEVKRGYLGVYFKAVNKNIANIYGLERSQGVLISEVVNDSPAEKAGFQPDDIILEIDGKKVDNEQTLSTAIASKKPGDNVTVAILRNEERKKLTVTLGEMPEEEQPVQQQSQEITELLGFSTNTLNDKLRKELNVGKSVKGVVVAEISERSRAYAEGGLRQGDIIIEVNRRNINNQQQFTELVSQMKKGSPMVLKVVRDGRVGIIDFRL